MQRTTFPVAVSPAHQDLPDLLDPMDWKVIWDQQADLVNQADQAKMVLPAPVVCKERWDQKDPREFQANQVHQVGTANEEPDCRDQRDDQVREDLRECPVRTVKKVRMESGESRATPADLVKTEGKVRTDALDRWEAQVFLDQMLTTVLVLLEVRST